MATASPSEKSVQTSKVLRKMRTKQKPVLDDKRKRKIIGKRKDQIGKVKNYSSCPDVTR